VIADSRGWHDTPGGTSNAEIVRTKYGEASYQTHRNAMHRNGRDGLLVELGKWGLGKRDVVPNVNFFSKVVADDAGRLQFDEANSRPGAFLDIRFEMNVLVVLSAAPHPLDPRPDYAPGDVMLTRGRRAPAADDLVVIHAENRAASIKPNFSAEVK
jgi:uncharacterized protein YcgI (DUF1989 family)